MTRRTLGLAAFVSAAGRLGAPFGSHVLHVIGVRPQEQMFRIAAATYIAMMADKHAGRYRTVGIFPGKTVRNYWLAVEPDLPVSPSGVSAIPQPATAVGFWYNSVLPSYLCHMHSHIKKPLPVHF
jgi:hypothetical protein